MRYLLLAMALSACAHQAITASDWEDCEITCIMQLGVKEACKDRQGQLGCHCFDDEVIWLEEN